LLKANIGAEGLTFTAGLTDDWITAVKALASEGRADVLSAPSVLASDNKPATINVVTQIPVATSSYDTENGVTTTSIQYRDTGIILSVTPHINDDGMVSMEISQEVSSVAEGAGSESAPAFFNRNVTTSLSVRDQQTLVIGGLISQTKSDNSSGVPGLSTLPVIGFLFGNKKDDVTKNELIIMITPRVINTLSDIDSVSNEFKSKFSDLKLDTEMAPVSD
jgi:general secretion pathway protein D